MRLLVCFCFAFESHHAAVPFTIPFAVESYTGHLEAVSDDSKTGAVVYWKADEDEIHVGLAAAAMWVGFGMNEKSPSMQGADIVVCREHKPGVVSAADYIAPRLGAPELDTMQDWVTSKAGRVHYKPPAPPAGACKSGWVFGMNKCFKVGQPATFAAAKSACVSEGGRLVNIMNKAENDYVLQLALGTSSSPPERALVWVGAERADASSQWKTSDGTASAFTNWHTGAPTKGQYDNCAVLGTAKTQETYWKKPDNNWWSADCRWNLPRSVCERDVEAGTPKVDVSLYETRQPVTWCEISRARKTCDPLEDYQVKDLHQILTGLLAWSPPAQGTDLLRYHQAGHRRQQLFSFSGAAPSANAGKGANDIDLIFSPPDHTVSAASGSFAYSYHKFNVDASRKYHVIKWRAAWDKKNSAGLAGLHHHMDLRACTGPIPNAQDGGVISTALAMQYCTDVFLVASRTLPSDEGITVGKGGPVYFAIERHFYNPTGKTNKVDTGAKFYVTYTSQLRAKDISSLQIGTLALKVPKNTFGYVVRSHCPPGCTSKMGKVVANRVSFHAHGHTRAAILRVVRKGVELEPLAHIEPYDDALASRRINRQMEPGDELLLDCVYDNDLNKTIKYGSGIDDEMCWATLTVVGKSPMAKCLDYPDVASNKWATYDTDCKYCVDNKKFDGACWQCNLVDPFSRCPGVDEDMSTGRVDDKFSRRGDPNSGLDATSLKYVPWKPMAASCAAFGTPVIVPAIPGKCPVGKENITGSKECKFKWGGSMRVSWTTDCTAKTVTFQMERGGTMGWMAIGLHDAGTAAAPKPLTPTRMKGADIVQVSAATKSLKDALGTDYVTPGTKSSSVAKLISTAVVGGRQKASFFRSFASVEGTSLVEDGFVWLVCAYRDSSNDLDAKHAQAAALSQSRISLFGGVAESTRYIKNGTGGGAGETKSTSSTTTSGGIGTSGSSTSGSSTTGGGGIASTSSGTTSGGTASGGINGGSTAGVAAPPIVNTFSGSFSLKMSVVHATSLTSDPKAKGAFANAVASTIGLSAGDVVIKGVYVNGEKVARRLENSTKIVDATVKVDYEIKTIKNITSSTINVLALKTNVQKEASAIGKSVIITALPTVAFVRVAPSKASVGSANNAPASARAATRSTVWAAFVFWVLARLGDFAS